MVENRQGVRSLYQLRAGARRCAGSGARSGAGGMLTLLVVAVLGVAAIYGGRHYWKMTPTGAAQTDAILHEIVRDDFVLDITERGEIKSAGVVEIRSEVKSKNTPGVAILRIVPEGTLVEKGDFICELDSSALDAELTTQKISCNTVEALVIEADNVYQTAVIAKREYLEGTYLEARQTIESEVFVAEENLNRAVEYYEYSKKLATKGYVNELQLEADAFAVEKSKKELEAAQTKLKVLDEFTKAKTIKQLESDILISKAKWEANQNSYQLELNKLKDIEDQIAKCTIYAPQAGIVTYAHEHDHRGNDGFVVEEGAVVRERQAIVEIPESKSMQVEIKINESLIQFVAEGMPAKIAPVGMGDVILRGSVEKVNLYAEPSSWRKANVKEYKAFVIIKDPPPGLRSGLTSSVTIECAYVPDALKVPVQSVYSHGDQMFCLTHDGKKWHAKEVECGPTNDKFFVIEGGLQEHDRVALNPRKFLSEVTLPELPAEQQQRAVPQGKRRGKEMASKGANKQGAEQQKVKETKAAASKTPSKGKPTSVGG